MNKTILLLIGPSGCGKSTLEEQLCMVHDATKVISVTTRGIRRGEVNGKDYHFVSGSEFNRIDAENAFIQTIEFAGNRYGTTKAEYTTDHQIAILSITPKSAVTFIPCLQENFPNMDIKIIYFDITHDQLLKNMTARGDAMHSIMLRLTHDDIEQQFIDGGLIADMIITEDMLDYRLAETVRDHFKI